MPSGPIRPAWRRPRRFFAAIRVPRSGASADDARIVLRFRNAFFPRAEPPGRRLAIDVSMRQTAPIMSQREIRILTVGERDEDASLLVSPFERAGYAVAHERVDTAGAMSRAVADQAWDLVLCDGRGRA